MNYLPPVYDQGREGSCTANAICFEVQHLAAEAGTTIAAPSRQFQYNQSRTIFGNFNTDGGMDPAYAFKSAHDYGIAPEYDLTYGPANLYVHPSSQALADALNLRITGTTKLNIYQGGQYVAADIDLAI